MVDDLFAGVFEDSAESRRLVAVVLYGAFIPLAVAVVISRGGLDHPALLGAGSALLLGQFGFCLIVDGIDDTAAAVLTVAVPATYVLYVAAAHGADQGLWPCLVLPVLWCAVFLRRNLVLASVCLNTLATVVGLSLQETPSVVRLSLEGLTRFGVLAVAALIVHGLVGHMRAARDAYRLAAETLQADLLPEGLPAIPGFELSAVYHPAAEGQQVGGDFYDVFATSDSTYGVLLGDVQGKDFTAARVSGLVRHTVRALAYRLAQPAAVLDGVNAALVRASVDRFCTLVYAVLSLDETPTLAVACAGHPPPILRLADGSVRAVGGRGPLLGVTDAAAFEAAEFPVDRGMAVVFYSDGLIEARAGGEFFGEQRLEASVATAPAAGDRFADAMWDAVASFAGRPQDDIAVVVLERPAERG